MLDYLFESAQKRKKEEVDNLLIITAPRERLLLGILAAFILAAGVWAAVGDVDRVVEFDGVIYRVSPDQEQSLRAATRVPTALARSVSAGMTARVEVSLPNGTVLELPGLVLEPQAEPLPERLDERIQWPIDGARRVDVVLVVAGEAIPPALEGEVGRVSISLGRRSIADLLVFRPS